MTAALVALAGVLMGTVTVGPLTPVCRVGVPCDGPARHVVLTFSDQARSVSTTTDGNGHYRVSLASGRWTVHASVGMSIRPSTVAVHPGVQRLSFSVDTGIR